MSFYTLHRVRSTALILVTTWVCAPVWAAHPLQTDDTDTQKTDHWQLELNTDRTASRPDGQRRIDQQLTTTLSYGITDRMDAVLSQPTSWQRPSNGAHRSGINDTSLGLKWRLWEDSASGWSLGVSPALTLPTGSASRGFGNGRATAQLNTLALWERGQWQWLINTGAHYNDNTSGARKTLWNASTALLYNPSERWSWALELTANRNPNRDGPASLRTALVGAIYHLGEQTDIDLGLRRNWQRGVAATTVGTGITQRW